jgi:hypothetical protein
MRTSIAIVLALGVAGCASVGTKVDTAQVQQFQKGVTTYSDVVAAVGEPTNVTTAADGAKIAVYTYAQATVRPETLIPYVSVFGGGADTKATAVIFRFDASDKLVDYSTSVSNTGAGYGVEAK